MFIERIEPLPLEAVVPYSVFYAAFDKEAFQTELYSSFGIEPLANYEKCVDKRRAEYLAGRYCARRALESIGVIELAVGSNQDRSPIWPTDVVGSITHSNNFAAAAVNFKHVCQGIGIDIEQVFGEKSAKLKKHICSENEITYLQSLADNPTLKLDINMLFTLAFSAKEAFYKALYPIVKVFFYFDSVEITSINPVANHIEFVVTKDIAGKIVQGSTFDCYYQMLDARHLISYCAILD